jgi:hypothetical protein
MIGVMFQILARRGYSCFCEETASKAPHDDDFPFKTAASKLTQAHFLVSYNCKFFPDRPLFDGGLLR